MKSFRHGGMDIAYREADHLISLAEVLLLDAYRADLLKKGDVVIDLGAGIGDFTVLASKRVGPSGRVVALEPNPDDFHMLKANVERNGCANVIALNLGVAKEPGQKEISFWSRRYAFSVDTLDNILARLKIDRADFIKMDIEGFETEVIGNSIEVIRQAGAISMELHGTKEEVDRLLLTRGFSFRPAGHRRAFISSLLAHPRAVLKALLLVAGTYPEIIRMCIGEAFQNKRLVTGVYVRPANGAIIIQ